MWSPFLAFGTLARMPIGIDAAIARARRLSELEITILRMSPYSSGGVHWAYTTPARRLCREGLLEGNPTSQSAYRITDDGEEVLCAYEAMRRSGQL